VVLLRQIRQTGDLSQIDKLIEAYPAPILWVIVTTSMMIKHENEIARLKYQAKSEFLANMSHEFRTPVNTILGMNEIILQDDPGDRITECSENIKTASNSLLTLINDVLDFSAIESGKLELVSESYDLDRLLNEEIAALNYAAGKKGIETVLVVDDNLPAQLEGDPHRVKQIIDNLISNAVKFTDNGQITFFVGGEINAGSDFSLIITISDTGSGISEEDKEKLFDSFDRLRHNKNRTVGGTGLGLAITKALVEMMNGTVTVKSVVGSGSVFTVKLPQKISGNSIIESFSCDSCIKHDTAARHFTIPDAHILAVDDNRMNLSVLGGLLKRYGIAPDIATGGNECMELCRKNKYDLIIMDHMMPSPDGIETMHAIRSDEDNPNRESSIVVFTANAVAGAKQRYIDEGFDDYLSKPVDIAALDRVLLTYIPESMVCEGEPVPDAPANAEPALNETAPNEYDPYIDRRVGMKYCGNDEGLYSEIIESYCEEGKKYRRQLKEYFDTNAIKFTSKGGVLLSVSARKESYGINLIISVKDSGIGIKEDSIDKIFNSFSRVDTKKNHAVEGTGLGLPISKRLVKMMDGVITVSSEYGKGTEFKVVIPQKVIDPKPIITVHEPEKVNIIYYLDTKKFTADFVKKTYGEIIELMRKRFAVRAKQCMKLEEVKREISLNSHLQDYIYIYINTIILRIPDRFISSATIMLNIANNEV
ncbi:MAG: ATP-binding protein, partial [Oscillospiraceae bacterium]